jgi:hypothetical protein
MKMILHDVVVNETPTFKCFKPTYLSHSIILRGDDVEDFLVIPLELHVVVSCFTTFKPSQEEFDTCSRYEFTIFETPEYDPSAKTFRDQEAGMPDSRGNLESSGDLNPKRRQICSLRQKEFEIKQLPVKYSDTLAKLQDLSVVLDDSTLIAELNFHANIPYFNASSVNATIQGKGGVYAATLTTNWGIGIAAAKNTHLMTTQRGIRRMIHPSLTKR